MGYTGPRPIPDMYHWEFGVADGTKSCCIQEFVDDKRVGISSGRTRGGRFTHS